MKISEQFELGEKVLATPMLENDAGAKTVREYLLNLAHKCWEEGEGFSGKRPFGNSGWEHEIYTAIAKSGMIEAKFDSDPGYENDLLDFDQPAANRLMNNAFLALGSTYT